MHPLKEIINEGKIFEILEKTRESTEAQILEIIGKAKKKNGLSLEEVGALVNSDTDLDQKILDAASQVKQEIYGERLVFFAPLYVSNYCINDCEYCGFHCRNQALRKKLTLAEVREQVKILEDMGHKRLLLEFGEHPVENSIDYVVNVVKTIYDTKSERGEIRRVNVNIAATTAENYKKLKEVGIGTYQLFQETYHQPTFLKLHFGPKADYERQITAHDCAIQAGIDDFGLGVLFGLYDWRFEVLGLVSHAKYLDQKYGVGPHTISVPRFRPAPTVAYCPSHPVNDEDFLKLIAILRLAVPYTGMIISTRERPEIRARAFEVGISQTSAASTTSPGGYKQNFHPSPFARRVRDGASGQRNSRPHTEQFSLSDHRSLEEVIKSILEQELLPSFCTACYRSGRTGERFMDLAKPGNIQNLCRPNALLTFMEYLEDYADAKTKEKGMQIINKYLSQIPSASAREETKSRLVRIRQGERDLYF